MHKSLVKLLGAVVVLLLSTTVSAVGMGGINVVSALGQPLKADIDLVAVSNAEKLSLVARLATPEAYKGAGLEYPYGNKFKFQVDTRPNGAAYLKVSSEQPINDPFVNMLIEMTWSSGKLMREYTFLLDPAGYDAGLPAPAAVQAIAPSVDSVSAAVSSAEPVSSEIVVLALPSEQAPQLAKPAPAPIPEPMAKSIPKPSPVPAQAPVPVPAKPMEKAEASVNPENVTVKRGDTMSKIAAQHQRPDVSLERMLIAIYRANAEQFDGNNINRIRSGKILRLPDANELAGVVQSDAEKEIRAHAADWNTYRQKLSGAAATSVTSTPSQSVQQATSGKISSAVTDKAPVAPEAAKEVLKLSKGEAPGDQAAKAAGGKSTEQDKKNAALEDAIAKDKAAKNEQAHVAFLEKNLADMKRLAELKSEAAALAAKTVEPESAVEAVSAPVVASAVKSAPVAKPKPKVQEEPALLDQILEEPLYIAGGAVALLALLGIGSMVRRRKKVPVADEDISPEEDIGEISSRIAEPVVSSPETGDFTHAVAHKVEASDEESDVDPISEAELFLNFGRDAQAEDILKEALKTTPNNLQIHLKLLSIYVTRKDADAFTPIARQIKDSGDADAWSQAAEMGRKLEPNNPMYGGSKQIEDAGSATMLTTPVKPEAPVKPVVEPDFIVDDTPMGSVAGLDVDFDLGADKTPDSPPKAADFTQAVKSVAPVEASASLSEIDNMLFDISSLEQQSEKQDDTPAETGKAEVGDMEFTLDLPVESPAVAKTPPPADVGFGDINLNFDAPATASSSAPPSEPTHATVAAAADGNDEHWQEVATKLDLAKAYQEMGDTFGAREILDEVVREGDEEQRATAQTMLSQLG